MSPAPGAGPVAYLGPIPAAAAMPGPEAVLAATGVPEDRATDRHLLLARRALEAYAAAAAPAAVLEEVSAREFADIFEGEGLNAGPNPLAGIFSKARRLALFAVTVGPAVCRQIERLFEENDYALGTLVDAAGSSGADLSAAWAEAECARLFAGGPDDLVLRYSPGYCGWHVTAQRKLFARLKPERAGITLMESCLMEPLKSVSGVVVLAEAAAHRFEASFVFCADCRARTCRAQGRC